MSIISLRVMVVIVVNELFSISDYIFLGEMNLHVFVGRKGIYLKRQNSFYVLIYVRCIVI